MKASLSWLGDYVTIEMDVHDLAHALTMVGLEVEAVIPRYRYLDPVKIGRIAKVAPHPNADRLSLCSVDIGPRTLAVVCGAPNVREGMLAPLALPGTTFPDGTVLKKGVIRGETSQGMLCSEAELGLGSDVSGIMDLSTKLSRADVGHDLSKALALSDWTLDIGLTPNRPDCLSMIGVAREIAAIQNSKLRLPAFKLAESETEAINDFTSVTVEDPEHCPRYSARMIAGITVAPSPFWLQDRLLSVDQRPINNLVDITNFVLMETGQPLHAFDFDQLEEGRVVVRTAMADETFTTLDGKERKLAEHMLMICDGQKAVGIGGVMGGLNSEIEQTTKRVLIESAYFNPVSIRKTAKALGLNTEASHRFERGVDPQGTIVALDRAAQLMTEMGAGTLYCGVIDEKANLSAPRRIDLSVAATNRLLGTTLKSDQMEKHLQSIGFKIAPPGSKQDPNQLKVTVPSFRVDVERPEDLMEEVARLSGYNKIPTTFPAVPADIEPPGKMLIQRNRIRSLLNGFGFTEVINYSFTHKNTCDRLKLAAEDPRREQVEILNPLNEDQTVMRTSLVPGLLETMQHNLAHQVKTLKIFEVGRIFMPNNMDVLPEEIEMLAVLWTGQRCQTSWHGQDAAMDFYDLKGICEGLLDGLNINNTTYQALPAEECTYTRVGYSAQIRIDNKDVGTIAEIDPMVQNHFDLKQPVYIFEIDLSRLMPLIPDSIVSQPIPKFPSISRDITLIIDKSLEAAGLLNAVRMQEEELIDDIFLFDLFEGKPIPPGKKSISFRIVYRSSMKTLKDEDINQLHQKITQKLLSKFGADLPG
jgi:phenylalanyl-tRNA synthetase beta chain